jgi:hypothetical protein
MKRLLPLLLLCPLYVQAQLDLGSESVFLDDNGTMYNYDVDMDIHAWIDPLPPVGGGEGTVWIEVSVVCHWTVEKYVEFILQWSDDGETWTNLAQRKDDFPYLVGTEYTFLPDQQIDFRVLARYMPWNNDANLNEQVVTLNSYGQVDDPETEYEVDCENQNNVLNEIVRLDLPTRYEIWWHDNDGSEELLQDGQFDIVMGNHVFQAQKLGCGRICLYLSEKVADVWGDYYPTKCTEVTSGIAPQPVALDPPEGGFSTAQKQDEQTQLLTEIRDSLAAQEQATNQDSGASEPDDFQEPSDWQNNVTEFIPEAIGSGPNGAGDFSALGGEWDSENTPEQGSYHGYAGGPSVIIPLIDENLNSKNYEVDIEFLNGPAAFLRSIILWAVRIFALIAFAYLTKWGVA